MSESDLMHIIERVMNERRVLARASRPTHIGKPYRPGTGSEGAEFDDAWCAYCARDAEFRKDDHSDGALGCRIIADSFAFDITDPRYPKEWVYGRDGRPCCTAFTTDPSKPSRCDKTLDLFGA